MASIFARIIAGKAPAERLFETDHELAFLDILPKSPGHTLVVPKLELSNFNELPPERVASLARTAHTVARGIVRAMETAHYNLILNNGAAAGQVVFHVHLHIIPRFAGGSSAEIRSMSAAEVGARIRSALRQFPIQDLGGGWIPAEG